VAAIDLDHFKSVNDRFGHDAGDTVLVAFANRLRSSFREKDRVYRLGGEEFMVIAEGLSKVEAAARLDALRDSTRTMPEIDGMPELQVRFSAGLARWPEDDPHLENVLRMADDRLYGAKNAGRSQTRSE
jgi:diguanylate cyclase (GGDEF)-like protein